MAAHEVVEDTHGKMKESDAVPRNPLNTLMASSTGRHRLNDSAALHHRAALVLALLVSARAVQMCMAFRSTTSRLLPWRTQRTSSLAVDELYLAAKLLQHFPCLCHCSRHGSHGQCRRGTDQHSPCHCRCSRYGSHGQCRRGTNYTPLHVLVVRDSHASVIIELSL